MRPRLLVLGVAFSCLLVADENARQKVHVTTTEHLDFSPGGTLRMPAAPHKLHLRFGFGDIVILKMAKPATPAPLNSAHE